MIKKNQFILFNFYFFAVQPVICGILRNDKKFFRLSAINCLFILIILIIGREKGTGESGNEKHNKSEQVKDEKISYYQTHQIQKKPEIKIPHIWFFIIAILAGILCRYRLGDIATYIKAIICILGSYTLYIILGLIFKCKIFKTRESILFMILTILACIRGTIEIMSLNTENINALENSSDNQETLVGEDEILSGMNIGSGFFDIQTGEIETGIEQEINEEETIVDLAQKATFTDIIKYILNNVPLMTDTKITFQNISKADENYKYFRTAYDKKMIGTDINPNKNTLCETYIVMKGLAEGRNVGNYSNIKEAYRNYAKNHNMLPNCKYGTYVTLGDLQ